MKYLLYVSLMICAVVVKVLTFMTSLLLTFSGDLFHGNVSLFGPDHSTCARSYPGRLREGLRILPCPKV